MKTRNSNRPSSPPSGAPYYSIIQSPVGDLMLVAGESALIGLYFVGRGHVPAQNTTWMLDQTYPVIQKTSRQLEEYFAGQRKSFDLPLHLSGTDFQKRIWQQIAQIPYSKTITYSDLATQANAPHATRAAGTATGANPISIIIPCHRVVGKNGHLCGFAGGLDNKTRLLRLEASWRSGVPAPELIMTVDTSDVIKIAGRESKLS